MTQRYPPGSPTPNNATSVSGAKRLPRTSKIGWHYTRPGYEASLTRVYDENRDATDTCLGRKRSPLSFPWARVAVLTTHYQGD